MVLDNQTGHLFKTEDEQDLAEKIGEIAEGGIVFYIDETGKHGLVASLEDLSNQAIEDTIYDMFLNNSIILSQSLSSLLSGSILSKYLNSSNNFTIDETESFDSTYLSFLYSDFSFL